MCPYINVNKETLWTCWLGLSRQQQLMLLRYFNTSGAEIDLDNKKLIMDMLLDLTTINISYAQLADISILKHLPQAKIITLRGNHIQDISALQYLTDLLMVDL